MLEAADTHIGKLLVQTGLASYNSDGTLNYHPEQTNTMVVIIGDNGTYAISVKLPFDLNLSKGTVYQTGVWVPLIISGPLVASPNREITSMVNIADLFQLWGEFAGIDVHQVDPHIIDSQSMLPYLTNPAQGDIRQVNFTQTQPNIHLNNQPPPPCVVAATSPATCVQIFPQKRLCEFEGGVWYGPGGNDGVFDSCCQVLANRSQTYPGLKLLPDSEAAVRNDHYKLVRLQLPDCSPTFERTVNEFYTVDEVPFTPAIDYPQAAHCANDVVGKPRCPNGLTQEQLDNYNSLTNSMNEILMSQPACPGDGNEDLLVNDTDLSNWQFFSTFNGGGSSWYDFDFNGMTDTADEMVIEDHLGANCAQQRLAKGRNLQRPR
jgi:hypothetical protein